MDRRLQTLPLFVRLGMYGLQRNWTLIQLIVLAPILIVRTRAARDELSDSISAHSPSERRRRPRLLPDCKLPLRLRTENKDRDATVRWRKALTSRFIGSRDISLKRGNGTDCLI